MRERLGLFVRRAAAYWVDATIAFAIVAASQLAVLTPLRAVIGIDDAWFRDGWHTQGYTLVTISLPVWCFFALFEGSRRGATPGKRLLRLRVRDARAEAGDDPIGIPRAFVRALVKLLPWELAHLANNLPVPMWYADDPEFRFLFAASGIALAIAIATALLAPRGRTPHDLAAGSIVTRLCPPASAVCPSRGAFPRIHRGGAEPGRGGPPRERDGEERACAFVPAHDADVRPPKRCPPLHPSLPLGGPPRPSSAPLR